MTLVVEDKILNVATRLPAQDIDRARRWYLEKLGLKPAEERPGGLRYCIGTGEFSIFLSSGRSMGTFTQLAITVDDIRSVTDELKRRGVNFLEYESGRLKTIDGIAHVAGNYPSKGSAELGCWFHDSEGNLISLGESLKEVAT